MTLHTNSFLVAASLVALIGTAQAQTSPQSEMNRGVPGVDVDVGRNAQGAVDVNRSGSEMSRGVPGVDVDVGRNARGAVDVNVDKSSNRSSIVESAASTRDNTSTSGTRAARADRN